jgi:methylenetetrahydrofolate--tRNA-(uracil-5-)-methyltransferase
MNVNFGLLPPLPRVIRDRRRRAEALAERALAALEAWRRFLG